MQKKPFLQFSFVCAVLLGAMRPVHAHGDVRQVFANISEITRSVIRTCPGDSYLTTQHCYLLIELREQPFNAQTCLARVNAIMQLLLFSMQSCCRGVHYEAMQRISELIPGLAAAMQGENAPERVKELFRAISAKIDAFKALRAIR